MFKLEERRIRRNKKIHLEKVDEVDEEKLVDSSQRSTANVEM